MDDELALNVPLQPNQIYVIEWRRIKHYWATERQPSSFSPDGYADCFVEARSATPWDGWDVWTSTRSEETLARLKEQIKEMELKQNWENAEIKANPKEGAAFKQVLETRITKIHYTA